MGVVIQVDNLNKHHRINGNIHQILNHIDFRVNKGEMISIIGPSGSGKSTLLSILGTLDQPTNGEVTLNGIRVTQCNEKELVKIRSTLIGFVFQNYNLISSMTARENIYVPLMAGGVKQRKQLNHRAIEVLRDVGLEDQADKLPSQMSGGQQQRVAIARALANFPQIVFMDEPTGNLDSKATQSILELLHRLRDQYETTFVIVTHDEKVAAHSDRILQMSDGGIFEELGGTR